MRKLSANSIPLPLAQQLLEGSLSDAAVLRATAGPVDYPILPWANVVKIGGQSLIDRGRTAERADAALFAGPARNSLHRTIGVQYSAPLPGCQWGGGLPGDAPL